MAESKRVLTVRVELPHYSASEAVKHTGEIAKKLEEHYGVDTEPARVGPKLLGISVA